MKKNLPKCPKCQAEMLRATDMSPLWFPEKEQCEKEGYEIGIDDYVHMDILCDNCGHSFTADFYTDVDKGLGVKQDNDFNTTDNANLNVILDSLEPTSLLYKSLNKTIEKLGKVENNKYLSPDKPITQRPVENFNYNVREVLQSVKTISYSDEMTAELRKEYGTDFNMITACVKENMIKSKAIALIQRIAPICYKINGKVFLKGETKGEHDFIGDDLDHQTATELYDMSTEMDTGDSYSFYVSSTDNFELATCEEMEAVKIFLDKIK